MKRILLLHWYFALLFAQGFKPEPDSELTYKQVLFRWPQVPQADYYTLSLTDIESGFTYNTLDSSNCLVYEGGNLEWGKSYRWTVCGMYGIDTIHCFDSLSFSLSQLPTNFPNNINLLELDVDDYTLGINLLDFRQIGYSTALDMYGDPLWFSNLEDDANFCAIQMLRNGNMCGTVWGNNGYKTGYEVGLDGQIIFELPEPSAGFYHHDIIKTSKQTYFGLLRTYQEHPSPPDCGNCPDSVIWGGDIVLEFDEEGNMLWEWNTFDHISLEEYNPYDSDHWNGTYFDWTHTNSVHYDDATNTVYISIRNISRILKIDYDTGNVIWQLGDPDLMLEQYFPEDINNSRQHNVKKLDNGNILFFDNGTHNTPQISRCLEIAIDENVPSAEIVWEYILPDSMFTQPNSECDRMPNGHTLISAGDTGNILELNGDDEIVWHLNVKLNNSAVHIMRDERIPNLYPSAFTIILQDYNGATSDPFVAIDTSHNLRINIVNKGWLGDDLTFHVNDYFFENHEIDSLFVDKYSTAPLAIDMSQIDLGSTSLELLVTSKNAPGYPQELEFRIICGGDSLNCYGCMDPDAINYNPYAVIPDSCEYLSVDKDRSDIPNAFTIQSVFPNPFNSSISIQFSIVDDPIQLEIMDLTGRSVETLVDGNLGSGFHEVKWNVGNQPSGLYFVKLTVDDRIETKKIIYLK